MEQKITLKAHAKLNLTMEILGKRSYGYHDIRSVMQFISLFDTIDIEQSDYFRFWCDDCNLLGNDNLAVKAYWLMQPKFDLPPVSISLQKRVPYMSGMGGGSADCAAVLSGLNTLFHLGLSHEQLADFGKTLGADVPACIHGHTLLAEGIGEKITPVQSSHTLHFCVIKPKVSFCTKEMYERMDCDNLFQAVDNTTDIISALASGNPQAVASCFYNSFEQVAMPVEPIETAKQLLLEHGAVGSAMTGAGSAVFGLFADKQTAQSAYTNLLKTGVSVHYCHSL